MIDCRCCRTGALIKIVQEAFIRSLTLTLAAYKREQLEHCSRWGKTEQRIILSAPFCPIWQICERRQWQEVTIE